MRKTLLAALLALGTLPGLAIAQDFERTRTRSTRSVDFDPQMILNRLANPLQVENCFSCELGLWDDLALTNP